MSNDSPGVPNVLVVEDEMVLRMRAVDIVEDAGFRSVEAVNADEAISILESRSDISLLFTDIQMPGSMDGLKLAHAVRDPNGRAYNRTAHLPERHKMMQQWADYLDRLKAGAEAIPLLQRA